MDSEDYMLQGETIDDLQLCGLMILQKEKAFRFGTDAVVLSNYAAKYIGKGKRVLDIGTGTGIIPILLSAKTHNCTFVGVEIQKDIADMAKRSVFLNEQKGTLRAGSISVVCDNICKIAGDRDFHGTFDCVVTNPPYYKLGTGYLNERDSLVLARHEITCTLDDIIKAACVCLRPLGRFMMINRPERLADTIESLRRYSLEPKEIQFVYADATLRPVMFLVEAVKGGGAQLIIEKGLVIN